jgi:acetyltransferase-like isoleucine patch superfamily enzyme
MAMMLHLRLGNLLSAMTFRLLFGHRFGRFGRGSRVLRPVAIEGPRNIHLGDDVLVAAHSALAAVPHTGAAECRLEIGAGSRIGRFNHLYATRRVVLGRQVLTANNVYIADNLHGFEDPSRAILAQPIVQRGEVEIGEGSWLGHNACVLGARIGRHCVVGANAVVTRDVPDHCVVVGAPAVIVKRYDAALQRWRRTAPDGSFID